MPFALPFLLTLLTVPTQWPSTIFKRRQQHFHWKQHAHDLFGAFKGSNV